MSEILSFGQWLLLRLSQVKKKQSQLAEHLGVTKGTVSNWVGDKCAPSLNPLQMQNFCEFLGNDLETVSKAFAMNLSITDFSEE